MSRFFIDRPVFAWVLSIVIVLAGLVAVKALPVAQYPPIVPPTIQVTATYPGASASTLSDTVAQPIEAQIVGVEGAIYAQGGEVFHSCDPKLGLNCSYIIPQKALINASTIYFTANEFGSGMLLATAFGTFRPRTKSVTTCPGETSVPEGKS